MSSATILYVLNDMVGRSKERSKRHTVVLAFGPGLSIEGVMLKKRL